MFFKFVSIAIVVVIFLVECSNKVNCKKVDLSRGFGDNIKWMRFEDALEKTKTTQKPIFLLIHKTWCSACKNLKASLFESLKFKEMSEHFLMVNLQNNEEPEEKIYAPDGKYIPRILFIDTTGEVRHEIINENGNAKYKYFYSNSDQVVETMERALNLLYGPDEIFGENQNEEYHDGEGDMNDYEYDNDNEHQDL